MNDDFLVLLEKHFPDCPDAVFFDPDEAAPFFAYSEVFEDGRCYRGESFGGGYFSSARTTRDGAAFVVAKDRQRKTLVVRLNSPALKTFLHKAAHPAFQPSGPWHDDYAWMKDVYSFDQLSPCYHQYRCLLSKLEKDPQLHHFCKIWTLFTKDFLLDFNIWSSLALESTPSRPRRIDPVHWRGMKRWSTEADLHELKEYFDTEATDGTAHAEQDDDIRDALLLLAAEDGDAQEVEHLLSARKELVKARCLAAAVNGGHRRVCQLLLDFGISLEDEFSLRGIAIVAARRGFLSVLLTLLALWQEPVLAPWEREQCKCYTRMDSCLRWFLKWDPECCPLPCYPLQHLRVSNPGLFDDIVTAAARGGRSDILAACLGLEFPTQPFQPTFLPESGRKSYTDHPVEHTLPSHSTTQWVNKIVAIACEEGHESVITWLHQVQSSFIDPDAGHIQDHIADYVNSLDVPKEPPTFAAMLSMFSMLYDGHATQLKGMNMRTKQGCFMRECVRQRFLLQHKTFLRRSTSTLPCELLLRFQRTLTDPRTVWRQGVDTIHDLLKNRPPGNIADVFCCIQVSRAIRRSLRVCHKQAQIPTEDPADLKRWMAILPTEQQPLFGLVSRILWSQERFGDCGPGYDDPRSPCTECSLSPGSAENWRLCHEEALSHFQKMFEALISETRSTGLLRGNNETRQGERLSTIQERYQVDTEGQNQPALESWSIPPHRRPPDPPDNIPDSDTIAQPQVVMLAATSIFMVIIAFLVLLHFFRKIPVSPGGLLQFATSGSLAHYSYIIAVYYGISHEVPVPEFETNPVDPSFQPSTADIAAYSVPTEGAWPWISPDAQKFDPENSYADEGMDVFDTPNESFSSRLQSAPDTPSRPSPISATSISSYPLLSSTSTQSTLQSTPATMAETSHSSLRKQCPHCQRTFSSVSNLGKHIRSDCRRLEKGQKQTFLCRNLGCGKSLTREAYRNKHEQEKCVYK